MVTMIGKYRVSYFIHDWVCHLVIVESRYHFFVCISHVHRAEGDRLSEGIVISLLNYRDYAEYAHTLWLPYAGEFIMRSSMVKCPPMTLSSIDVAE